MSNLYVFQAFIPQYKQEQPDFPADLFKKDETFLAK